jgi:hypothetical protein
MPKSARRLAAATICSFALALFCVLSPIRLHAQASCSDATVCSLGVFCSGFEEGNKSIWDDYDGNPDSTNLLMADPGPCNRAGNSVMRLRVPPGRGGSDLVKVLPGSYDKLYARWYQRWEPGYNFSAPNHGGGLHAGDRNFLGQSDIRPTGADWFTSWIEPLYTGTDAQNGRAELYSYYRGMNQHCGSPCWGDSFPTPAQRTTIVPPKYEAGKWYCIEMMLDGGTPVSTQAAANGVQTFWIDDVQYGPWTNLWHRTTANLKINILWLSLFHHDSSHSTEGIMLDDVVVSTARIGCHGAASPTAPRPPTSLRLVL